nr:D-tyrosyl-tRNA(Tyr) deacylase [Oceanococcus sp. HetDA_MAG_MS8]
MRLVLQRVTHAQLRIDHQIIHHMQQGLVVLVGVAPTDGENLIPVALEKISTLRIFADAAGKTNLSLLDIQGGLLLVPNFTLYADARRGRRPSFTAAAPPAQAAPLFDALCERSKTLPLRVGCGVFGADMQVELENDGPFTLVIDL